MCMSLWTRFMTSTGQGLPAMIPVRRLSSWKLRKLRVCVREKSECNHVK